jgi:YD repeat-containing protein
MRASTASMILAFCAMLAVQAAPVSTDSAFVARGTHDFEYDADGNEIAERGTHDFEYDADGNEIAERGTNDFQYDEAGNEIEKREPKKVRLQLFISPA